MVNNEVRLDVCLLKERTLSVNAGATSYVTVINAAACTVPRFNQIEVKKSSIPMSGSNCRRRHPNYRQSGWPKQLAEPTSYVKLSRASLLAPFGDN